MNCKGFFQVWRYSSKKRDKMHFLQNDPKKKTKKKQHSCHQTKKKLTKRRGQIRKVVLEFYKKKRYHILGCLFCLVFKKVFLQSFFRQYVILIFFTTLTISKSPFGSSNRFRRATKRLNYCEEWLQHSRKLFSFSSILFSKQKFWYIGKSTQERSQCILLIFFSVQNWSRKHNLTGVGTFGFPRNAVKFCVAWFVHFCSHFVLQAKILVHR